MSDPAVNQKYIILNAQSGTVIDLAGGSTNPGAHVQGYAVQSGNPNQQWVLSPASGTQTDEGYKYYYVTNVASGNVLDVAGDPTISGSKLVCNPKNANSENQKWRFWLRTSGYPSSGYPSCYGITTYGAYKATDGTDKFKVDLPNDSSVNENQLQMYTENDSNGQRWFFFIVPA